MKKKSIIIISVSVALTLMIITSLFVTIFVNNNRNKFTGTVFAQISDKVYSEYAHKIKKVYIAEGDTIKVYISGKGAMVPDVTGMNRQDAVNLLYDAGFKVMSISGTSITADKDVVIEQSPSAGSSAEKGSTIYITVNR